MKKLIIIAVILLVIGFGIWHFFINSSSGAESQYEFVEVERGGLENIVTSTGTIEAVNTVEVGTQVSGIIKNIFVDFNDKVSKEQILALVDTAVLVSRVREAEASLIRAQAQYDQSLSEYNRNKPLFEKGFLSENEFIPIKTNLEVNRASLQTAQVSLNQAKINLQYAEIRSPIDGIIINRSVDMGQTVAASFQTPTLFIVAEDLSHMQILADVDESDIGQIKEGQEVRFTVQSYLDEIFYGIVRQIRLQPETIQNVVNYTVVIDAPNEELLLMPGMTATVDFVIERVENVLLVQNTALRFQPSEEMMFELMRSFQSAAGGGGFGGMQGGNLPKDFGRLWYVDENGNIGIKPVRTGVTDGLKTEIKMNQGIEEGMMFISRITKKEDSQSNTENRGFRGPPGFLR